jgi:DNA-binding transcriptional LysR family regulator
MNKNDLTFQQIRMVESIAIEKNISRAALKLNMTQPGVTRALQLLEIQLGVTLFDRLPEGLKPTVFVEPFLRRSSAIRNEMQQTKLELARIRRFAVGELSISTGVMAAETWLHKAISKLSVQFPNIRISINQSAFESTLSSILNGSADIGLTEIGDMRSNPLVHTDLVGRLECHFICRKGHPLDTGRDPTIEELRRFPFVGRQGIQRHMKSFGDDPGQMGLFEFETGDLVAAVTVSTLSGIIQVIRDNQAISIIPPELIRREIEDGVLVPLGRAHTPDLFFEIGFVTLAEAAVDPNIEILKEIIRQVEIERRSSLIKS